MKQTARSLFKSKFILLFSFFLGIPLPYFGKVCWSGNERREEEDLTGIGGRWCFSIIAGTYVSLCEDEV
ncbi:hypothetical protein [Odoribacter laneus]|uniref:hypothetical protein n=1 Tax=Odoribacter laneus TaxID=626933 RepID=UPI0039961EFF